jgi:hypothetical protein
MTEETAAPVEGTAAPESSETDQMAAIWDKYSGEIEAETPEEQPVEAKPEPETTLAAIEAPTDLPAAVKAKWADIPEEAREAVLASHRAMAGKLTEQGRVTQAAKPVYDVLVQAAREIPSMQDMTPAQIAQDVFQMARVQGMLNADPVGTLLQIAQEHGALDGLRARLSGQAPDPQAGLAKHIQALEAQIAQLADPSLVDRRVEQTLAARDVQREVNQFVSDKKDLWPDAEPYIPRFIEMVDVAPGASPKDILEAAYDMAIHAIPALRAKVTAAAAPATDPRLTAAQMKAKSVNVVSRPSGQGRELSDREVMGAIYDKYRAS